MKVFKYFLFALYFTVCLGSNFAHADVVVIVSAKCPVETLSADQITQLFLGKVSRFPGGGRAVPIDQSEGSSARHEFYTKVTGKSPSQLKAYWSKQVFTGRGQPLRQVSGNDDTKELVAGNSNMIGYIDKDSVDESVKIILSP